MIVRCWCWFDCGSNSYCCTSISIGSIIWTMSWVSSLRSAFKISSSSNWLSSGWWKTLWDLWFWFGSSIKIYNVGVIFIYSRMYSIWVVILLDPGEQHSLKLFCLATKGDILVTLWLCFLNLWNRLVIKQSVNRGSMSGRKILILLQILKSKISQANTISFCLFNFNHALNVIEVDLHNISRVTVIVDCTHVSITYWEY